MRDILITCGIIIVALVLFTAGAMIGRNDFQKETKSAETKPAVRVVEKYVQVKDKEMDVRELKAKLERIKIERELAEEKKRLDDARRSDNPTQWSK